MKLNNDLFFKKIPNPDFLEGVQPVSIDTMAEAFDLSIEDLKKHIGEQATYTYKSELTDYLAIIHSKFMNGDIPKDEQVAIKEKLKEGAEVCVMGSMDRVQDIIRGFIEPTTVPELLASYRLETVNKARASVSEIHRYQEFYDVANQNGMALPLAGVKGILERELLRSEKVLERIRSAFSVDYIPAKIVENLLQSSFAKLGYAGRKQEGYKYNVYSKIFDFFKNCIDNESLSYSEVFLLGNNGEIIDINWIEVISQLIVYFNRCNYFTFDSEVTANYTGRPYLNLKIDTDDPVHSVLTIKTGQSEKSIFFGNVGYLKENHQASSALIKLIKAKGIEKTVRKHLRVLLFLNGFDLSVKESALKQVLPHLIADDYQLGELLKGLVPSRCSVVCRVIKQIKHDIIRDKKQFAILLRNLDVKQIKAVCKTFKEMMRAIIQDEDQLGKLLKNLNAVQIKAVCNFLKKSLRYNIRFGGQLGRLSRNLDPSQIKTVLESFDIILRNGTVFGEMLSKMQNCKEEQRMALYEFYEEVLPKLIQDAKQFFDVLWYLNGAQRVEVFEVLKKTLPSLIYNRFDLSYVLFCLNDAQSEEVYEMLKETIPDIITTGAELAYVLSYFNNAGCKTFCKANKETVLTIIRDRVELRKLLRCLNAVQIGDFCEPLQDIIPRIITSMIELRDVLKGLSAEQCKAFCSANKETLLNVIHNGAEFRILLQCVDASQIRGFCEPLQDIIPRIITSMTELRDVLKGLSAEQCKAFCSANKETVLNVIHNGAEFGILLQCLNADQIAAIFGSLKEIMPTIIPNSDEFCSALQYLDPEQCTVFCAANEEILLHIVHKEILPIIIRDESHSVEAFWKLLRDLEVEQFKIVCGSLKKISYHEEGLAPYTMPYIESIERSFDKAQQVYEAVCDQFSEVMRDLNHTQRKEFFEAVQDELPNIVSDIFELDNEAKFVNEDQGPKLTPPMQQSEKDSKRSLSPWTRVGFFSHSEKQGVVPENNQLVGNYAAP